MAATTIRLATERELPDMVRIDDSATELYAQAGLVLRVPAGSAFSLHEHARWSESVSKHRAFLAVDDSGAALGFAVLALLDGEPYLDQLSVHIGSMRRGIGRALLQSAYAWAEGTGENWLWLTTYRHLSWNAPFYAREGFRIVPEPLCGDGVQRHLAEQRAALPAPEQRIAMRKSLQR